MGNDVQILWMRSRIFLSVLLGSAGLVLSLITPRATAGTPNAEVPLVSQPIPVVVNAWGVLFQIRQRLEETTGREQTEETRGDLVLLGAALRVLQAENGKNVPVNIQVATQLQNLIQQNAALLESGGGKMPETSYAEMEKLYDSKLIEQARALAKPISVCDASGSNGPEGSQLSALWDGAEQSGTPDARFPNS